jgi:transposase-like protein
MLAQGFHATVDPNASHTNGGQQKAMVTREVCPRCQSPTHKKNGHIHNGKQNHQCHDGGRQFADGFEQDLVSADTRALIEHLLVERISWRGICRAVGGNLKWLLGVLVRCFEALPDHLHVQPVTCHGDVMIQQLTVEADAMSSLVHKKAKPAVDLDRDGRQDPPGDGLLCGGSEPEEGQTPVGEDSSGIPSARHVLDRSIRGLCRGDSRGAASGD